MPKPVTNVTLANEVGVSPTLVQRKRTQGKTDDQIREESVARAKKPHGGEESYALAQARKERALADKHELELLERRGELVERKASDRQAFETARIVRDGLMAIPDRLASLLAAESDVRKVHGILSDEIRKALVILAAEAQRVAA